jgi:ABC-type lipoprotein release transport system permease subunit
MLFGITPADVSTYVSTALLCATVAMLATLLPAHRACRIVPLTALRHE